MQTVVLEQPGSLALRETPPPEGPLPQDEALVRVQRVGVCGSDLKAFKGEMPFLSYPRVLGHELGVEILEIGPNAAGLRAGDRAAVEPYLHCGHCIACRRGRTNCCDSLRVLGVHTDGGMREFIRVPVGKLHPSDKLSLDQLALVETLVIGAHAIRRGAPRPDDCLLVIGVGPDRADGHRLGCRQRRGHHRHGRQSGAPRVRPGNAGREPRRRRTRPAAGASGRHH